jgi:hypothetical protein
MTSPKAFDLTSVQPIADCAQTSVPLKTQSMTKPKCKPARIHLGSSLTPGSNPRTRRNSAPPERSEPKANFHRMKLAGSVRQQTLTRERGSGILEEQPMGKCCSGRSGRRLVLRDNGSMLIISLRKIRMRRADGRKGVWMDIRQNFWVHIVSTEIKDHVYVDASEYVLSLSVF